MRRLFGGLGFASSVQPADADWAWVGNVSATSATVKVRSAQTPTLLYGLNLTDPLASSGAEGADNVWTFNLSGLTPDTPYEFAVFGWSLGLGRFRTFPSGPGSFKMWLASCAGDPNGAAAYQGPGFTSDSPAFAHIAADLDLRFGIFMGDRGYPDIGDPDVAAFRTNYNNNMANARQLAMHLAMPVAYSWSDHDYGLNDSVGSSASKPAAQQVYREHVPHWTLPSGSSIYQKIPYGDVDIWLLDVHSERSANDATDNSSKTMLGSAQKTWLKDGLVASTARLHVLGINTPWINGHPTAPTWLQFQTEAQELVDHIDTNGLSDRVLLAHGDHHFICGDDGTNSLGGFPVVGFAALDSPEVGGTSATYSEGVHTDSEQQYGTIEFIDNGASGIDVEAVGYAVTDVNTKTPVMTYQQTFPG